MSKWLSIELSLLLLVSLVAFAGFVSWQNNGDDLTGEAFYRPYRPPPRPVYTPQPQPSSHLSSQQKLEVLEMFNNAQLLLGHEGKSCSEECKTINAVCVSSVMSFRDYLDPATSRSTIGGSAIDTEAPQRCSSIYNARKNNTVPGVRANYCICAKP